MQVGVLSVGVLSVGVLSVGVLSVGVLSVGVLSANPFTAMIYQQKMLSFVTTGFLLFIFWKECNVQCKDSGFWLLWKPWTHYNNFYYIYYKAFSWSRAGLPKLFLDWPKMFGSGACSRPRDPELQSRNSASIVSPSVWGRHLRAVKNASLKLVRHTFSSSVKTRWTTFCCRRRCWAAFRIAYFRSLLLFPKTLMLCLQIPFQLIRFQ